MIGHHCRSNVAALRRSAEELRAAGLLQGLGLRAARPLQGSGTGNGCGSGGDMQQRAPAEGDSFDGGCGGTARTGTVHVVLETWMVECCRQRRVVPVAEHTVQLEEILMRESALPHSHNECKLCLRGLLTHTWS